MCQGDFARFRAVAATDQADIGDGVMRRAEGPLGYKRPLPVEQPHDTVDFGGFDRLDKRHPRQDGRQTPGKHRLAGAWRTEHEDIMRPGRCHLQRPLGAFLTTNLREIFVILRLLPEKLMNIDVVRRDCPLAV